MNILELLDEELKGKHLTELEKARYIYLRYCDLFSFDYRWFIAEAFKDNNMKKEILNKKIDLENVKDNRVICHNGTPLLKYMIDLYTSLLTNIVSNTEHSSLQVTEENGRVWDLDPTFGDMPKLKLGISPIGMSSGYKGHTEYLNEIDSSLGYSFIEKDDYRNRIKGKLYSEKIKSIGNILDTSKVKYHYSDTNYYLRMMTNKFIIDPVTHFDKDYNFHFLMEFIEDDTFFDVKKEYNEYKIKQINENEYEELVKTLRYK